ncbi:MAG: 2-isopropylmalate synthase [Candidatus Heimdallarchaeota archaeon]|nr:2-isopropylmalate synthase [Candidatus Heimdallarchaeota archaeon]
MDDEFIFDWNLQNAVPITHQVMLDDETLRDGLQSPSITDPPLEGKLQLVRLMEQLGIDAADIGFAGSSKKMYNDILHIAKMIRDEEFKLKPNCAARTHPADIKPIVEISYELEMPLEVAAFIASSPIRQYVEKWSVDRLLDLSTSALTLCTENDLPVMFVTEDTTRSKPEDIAKLYLNAVQQGAYAICISDTVGHATPHGTYQLVSFIRQILRDDGYKDIQIDWHGHRDRALSIANSLAAIEAGATRIHGAGLGIGERCGNTPLDLLLVNFKLMGMSGYADRDLSVLSTYTSLISDLVKVEIPMNYPVFGADAFRTATGVHASAILKAREKGLAIANTVYSAIPASEFGMVQQVEIGPMSGLSNVEFKLESLGYTYVETTAQDLLQHAKTLGRILGNDEIHRFMANYSII